MQKMTFTSILLVIFIFSFEKAGSEYCSEYKCMDHVYSEFPIEDLEREKRMAFYRSGKELASQVSDTLDSLLDRRRYNKQMRPPGESEDLDPVRVEINMAIRSMGPIDETKQVFSLDCYFRQSWTDNRLRFNTSGVVELVLNWKFLTKIWKPDTTFLNGQKSYLHKITVPNRFIRISPLGRVSYSQRLTLWASCPMYLGKFPFDSQTCALEIGSYGYTGEDITYVWASKPLSMDELGLAQYHLTDWSHGVATTITKRKISSGFRNDSVAYLRFDFERQTGFFLLGIYFPLTLIVMCSWVSFWIVKTDVPSRVALGVTTVLSVTKVGFGGKAKPQIGYATALDIYIIICFFFSFAALTEFAIINFIDVFFKRLKKWEEDHPEQANARKEMLKRKKLVTTEDSKADNDEMSEDEHSEQDENDEDEPIKEADDDDDEDLQDEPREQTKDEDDEIKPIEQVDGDHISVDIEENATEPDGAEQTKPNLVKNFRAVVFSMRRRVQTYVTTILSFTTAVFPLSRHLTVDGCFLYDETQYVVDRIDEMCRILFPLAFLLTSLIYWTFYLYIAED